ncbi:hypothetical protein FWH58_02760 [Candidatus Saccharibacteria bacterium]|nr:hypothetical protein [Candidatus Saccharibacteria bacterium]
MSGENLPGQPNQDNLSPVVLRKGNGEPFGLPPAKVKWGTLSEVLWYYPDGNEGGQLQVYDPREFGYEIVWNKDRLPCWYKKSQP